MFYFDTEGKVFILLDLKVRGNCLQAVFDSILIEDLGPKLPNTEPVNVKKSDAWPHSKYHKIMMSGATQHKLSSSRFNSTGLV